MRKNYFPKKRRRERIRYPLNSIWIYLDIYIYICWSHICLLSYFPKQLHKMMILKDCKSVISSMMFLVTSQVVFTLQSHDNVLYPLLWNFSNSTSLTNTAHAEKIVCWIYLVQFFNMMSLYNLIIRRCLF